MDKRSPRRRGFHAVNGVVSRSHDPCSSIRNVSVRQEMESGGARTRDSSNAGDREGARAKRNDEGEKRSDLFGPRAALRPDSSGRARGLGERGAMRPP